LKEIAIEAKGVFIPRGIELPNLDQKKEWEYVPNKDIKVGSLVSGGDVLGFVNENTLFQNHKIMSDPKVSGKIVEVFPEGNYTVAQPICVVETPSGEQKELSMSHFWPVRTPRPYVEKL